MPGIPCALLLMEGGIGIAAFYAKNHSKEETDRVLYKLSILSIPTHHSVTNDSLVVFPFLPESVKFSGICLTIGICLKDIVSALLNGVAISKQYSRAVPPV